MNYLSSITLIIIFISFFFAFFLFTVKTTNKLSNVFIGCFLIAIATEISVFFYEFYIDTHPVIDVLRDNISFLQSPFLFLYVLSMLYADFKLQYKHLLHSIPFVLITILFFPNLLDHQTIVSYLGGETYEKGIFITAIHIQFLIYIIAIFIILYKAKKIFLENYSQANTDIYKWLFQLNILISIVLGFGIFKNVFRAFSTDIQSLHVTKIIITLLLLGFICWIILKGLYNPKIFRGIDSNLKSVNNLITINESSSTINKIIDESIQKQINLLKTYMLEKHPYLNPTLTIQNLAEQIHIPSRELSVLINHHLNQHFFDFINEYRIHHAMNILKDPSKKQLTILEILYEVGFNSKSSFNTAFKKYANVTPTEYRKRANLV
ncbi:helix-turn-helix domain-containing protein [Aquimarina algiphila]|uniref:helix-turn-helix domain-containing protein n=1 Tax=Aquimarina algiphila TaxID=2047982 RepID=UPI00232BD5C3|nr:helix-turn-helix domain-containing protein [Aquimarina algiphila]